MKQRSRLFLSLIALCISLSLLLCSCGTLLPSRGVNKHIPSGALDNIPEFDGYTPYVIINNNIPFFTDDEISTASYEKYGKRDGLERCTVCIACIGIDIMPTEERQSISHITPTGWVNAEYDFIEGGYVYNRCHLIGFQLTGESMNRENLITGTQFLNIEGMLPFENMIAEYVRRTQNHVMLRVTPIFEGDNLVASGVLMEGLSVEDGGIGIRFNIYVYNCQPGVIIDYATGQTRPAK